MSPYVLHNFNIRGTRATQKNVASCPFVLPGTTVEWFNLVYMFIVIVRCLVYMFVVYLCHRGCLQIACYCSLPRLHVCHLSLPSLMSWDYSTFVFV
jgi:hypothetical protein